MNLNFRKKMLLTILPMTAVIFIVVGFSMYNSTILLLEHEGKKNGRLLVESYASKLETEFAAYLELEKSFYQMVDKNAIDAANRRQQYRNLARTFLENNPKILSFWVVFDRNAFDGQDDRYRNVDIYGEDGRFNFICTRGRGDVEFEKAKGTETEEGTNDWLLLQAKKRGATMVTEPFRFSFTGNPADERLMTTILSPVFDDNKKIIGAVGINISLDNFANFLNQLRPFNSQKGYALLFSAQGIYLSRPDGKLLGKTTLDNPILPKDIAQDHYNKARVGKAFDDDFFLANGARSLAFFYPVTLGETGDRMIIGVNLPYEDLVQDAGAGELLFEVVMFFGIGLILITIVVSLIASRLASPLKKAAAAADRIADGDLKVDLSTNAKDETGMLMHSLEAMVRRIDRLIRDTNTLSSAALAGQLEVRADISRHKGAFKELINGINKTLDAVIGPLNVTAEYVDRISKGDIPPRITDSYNGDFNEIKNNLNGCIDAITLLVKEINQSIHQAIDGDFKYRADVVKFQGEFRTIMDGVNELVETFVEPLEITSAFLQDAANGNENMKKITKEYKGEFNVIKGAINKLHEILFILLEEMLAAAAAAEKGNLDIKADTSKVQGAWVSIMDGLNKITGAAGAIINDAGGVLGTMATGDLTPRITRSYVGKFGDMKNSINNLGDSLTDLISRLTEAIHTTAAASAQISATADTLSEGLHEQSTQTDEVATAMEEMSRTVTDNADSATRTADVAKNSGDAANNGGKVVQQTVAKMREIAKVVRTSADSIVKLGESSKKIGEIISVIDDIADQTNLLSLNAAIEAARAGEQGRGFAVVADSVGKLAISTASATKEIADMIKGIQIETEGAVTAMEKGTAEVQSGIELADQAGNSIQSILSGINELLNMVNQIAVASKEQSTTSEQISKNVSTISRVAADSARNVEDVATTANDLARMTETLRALVSQFKIDDHHHTSAADTSSKYLER